MLADTPEDAHQPDVARMDDVAKHPWGLTTVAAIWATQSVREAARRAGVHHSTLSTRVDVISAALGFDPLDGVRSCPASAWPTSATACVARRCSIYLRHLRHLTKIATPAEATPVDTIGQSVDKPRYGH